jgi:hypothetical protein
MSNPARWDAMNANTNSTKPVLAPLTDEQYDLGIDRIRKAMESAEASGRTFYLIADLRLDASFGSIPS